MDLRKVLALAVALGFTMSGMTACNTVKGAGRDISGAGEAVQDASDDVKEEIDEEKND